MSRSESEWSLLGSYVVLRAGRVVRPGANFEERDRRHRGMREIPRARPGGSAHRGVWDPRPAGAAAWWWLSDTVIMMVLASKLRRWDGQMPGLDATGRTSHSLPRPPGPAGAAGGPAVASGPAGPGRSTDSAVSGPGKQTHDEWTSIMIRRLIVRKPSLMLMPFKFTGKQLWARMLSMLTAQSLFPLILRVVATAMTFTQPRAAAHWHY
jgi:hypothetical protein